MNNIMIAQNETFYRAKMVTDQDGLQIWFDVFKPIHETKCFYFCVNSLSFERAKSLLSMSDITNPVTALKQHKYIRVVRIAKVGCRIAQPSREKAIENLVYRTRLRVGHLTRDLEFCKAFIENKDCLKTTFDDGRQLVMLVESTKDVVGKYYTEW